MDDTSQVTVKLVTKLGPEFQVPDGQMAVPANVTRYGLSTIINHLLKLDVPKVFDVLLDGELLRQTLGDALLDRSISTETTIQLEYTFLVPPPQLSHSSPQPDWIRAIAGVPEGLFCCGSATGDLSVHSASGERTGTAATEAHAGGVTALCALPAGPRFAGPLEGPLAVSGGHDAAAAVWRLRSDGPTAVLRLEAHTDSVSAIAASSATVATGAWDSSVRLWQWHKLYAAAADPDGGGGGGAPAEKRPKAANGAAAGAPAAVVVTECAAVLGDHSQAVTGLAWADQHRLFSASLDHSMKRWDTTAGVAVETMATGKALLCCAAPREAAGHAAVVAAGGADGSLRWWDCRQAPRSSDALVAGSLSSWIVAVREVGRLQALRVFKGHSGAVTDVAWRPGAAQQVATAAHDGLMRLWDMRTSVPLATFDDCSSSKLLAVGWGWRDDSQLSVATGGEDSQLRVYAVPAEGETGNS